MIKKIKRWVSENYTRSTVSFLISSREIESFPAMFVCLWFTVYGVLMELQRKRVHERNWVLEDGK
jgi:hypothetical protein